MWAVWVSVHVCVSHSVCDNFTSEQFINKWQSRNFSHVTASSLSFNLASRTVIRSAAGDCACGGQNGRKQYGIAIGLGPWQTFINRWKICHKDGKRCQRKLSPKRTLLTLQRDKLFFCDNIREVTRGPNREGCTRSSTAMGVTAT